MSTIKDVAKVAGVSTSTVSRVITGNIPVNEATKKLVLQAIKELNYQPNIIAKGLKEKKTNTIGLIIPNILNPIFPAVARGVEDIARQEGYTLILCNTDEDLVVEKSYIDKLKNSWVDGLIFATAKSDSNHILELRKSDFPVVLLIRNLGEEVDAVIIDNYKEAKKAVKYLIDNGRRRIAIINGDFQISLYRDRYEGYIEALKNAGLEVDEALIIEGGYHGKEIGSEIGYTSMRKLLDKGIKIDAVFATSDPRATGAIKVIKEYGYKVPEDIAVIGFDNLEISNLVDPPLTTIAQPLYDMGARAATKLIKLINNEKPTKPIIDVLETELIIRKST